MRRRPPRLIELSNSDYEDLESLIRDGRTEQRVARRARILLAMTNPETIVQELAERVYQAPNTIWQVCRRYEEVGIDSVFDAPRSGRPRVFSPLATGRDRAVGLL